MNYLKICQKYPLRQHGRNSVPEPQIKKQKAIFSGGLLFSLGAREQNYNHLVLMDTFGRFLNIK